MTRNKSFDGNNILYLIATPIGNLDDISKRALDILSSSDLIACEDTRNTQSLLQKYGIKTRLVSLHEHNEKEASLKLIEDIKNGLKVSYVSDAGYPGISDPGYILVKECINNSINVTTICGATSLLAGLIPSGIDTSNFTYIGFLPVKEGEISSRLEEIKLYKSTLIFNEAPHRITKTLNYLNKYLGNRNAVIARELTKINEEFIRGNLSELANIEESTLKGEMVIIVEGNKENTTIDTSKIEEQINLLLSKGLSKKDAIEVLSSLLEIPKNTIKEIILK